MPEPPKPPTPDAATPPPAQSGEMPPLPPENTEKQAPPPALIEKLGNPGAAAAKAIDQSVDEKVGNIRDVQRERRVISNEDGVRVTVEPGGRVIVQSGEQAVIRHDDRSRFDRQDRDYRERRTRDGGREVIVDTRHGGEVRTLYDPNGMMIQRERRDRDGRVHVLFDNRSFGSGPADEPTWQRVVRLPPPPVYDLPRERYRVEMRSAPPRYVEEALTAPPLVKVRPEYTLDQVIYSPDLRERVRSVDLDTITFSSGAWAIERSQVASIEAVARGIEAALRRNPNEVFLVEGYTDAVGSVVDNLSLSDRRAEAVANVLTDHYGIPPEKLVTQGYGESYLKIPTERAERANRRVAVRRITPLLSTNGQP
ncbi:OmpA family protein [Pleomorphomonas sp. JP5]|uniref:OmpA family protein n=1 Tax=Pleomorphomonas sp. JP5 TaxID=2942998 RepID=UPI0020444D61|nr:OmpA family protein [Pleomorphomonas sp. JP5]MCM5556086.1 OmpA family protein [Pleomorphomonas sp. JP5]